MTIRQGILISFDAGTYTATVQLSGSLAGYLAAVPVARNIASAELLADRRIAVLFLDPANPKDAVIIAVWT